PYDLEALDPTVIEEACRSHPFVTRDGRGADSADYLGLDGIAASFAAPLPDPPPDAVELRFADGPLAALRRLVGDEAAGAGVPNDRILDLIVGANEIMSNSVE